MTVLNIRDLMKQMSIPQPCQHDLDLGAATTRTTRQKQTANLYTAKVINAMDNDVTFVNGSVRYCADNKPTNRRGYGGMLMSLESSMGHIKSTLTVSKNCAQIRSERKQKLVRRNVNSFYSLLRHFLHV